MAEGFITRKGGKGGVDVSDATATENDVLQGETFYAGDEEIKTGTIPSKGAETFTPGTTNQIVTAGQYLSGDQTILGDADLTVSNIKAGTSIFGINGNFTSDATAIAGDVLSGKTTYVNGNKITGTMTNRGNISQSLGINGTYTIPAGFHNGSGTVSQSVATRGASTITPGTSNQTIAANRWLTGTQTILGSANLVPSNIKQGVNIFGVIGTLQPAPGIPAFVAGISRVINGSNFIWEARSANNRSGSCTSGNPTARFFLDLRGVNVTSLSYTIDTRWYNSQPRQRVFAGAGNAGDNFTFDNSTNQWSVDQDLSILEEVNLFSLFGASNNISNFSRSYTFSGGRNDLILSLINSSCQAFTDRFLRVKSIVINGQNVAGLESNDNETSIIL